MFSFWKQILSVQLFFRLSLPDRTGRSFYPCKPITCGCSGHCTVNGISKGTGIATIPCHFCSGYSLSLQPDSYCTAGNEGIQIFYTVFCPGRLGNSIQIIYIAGKGFSRRFYNLVIYSTHSGRKTSRFENSVIGSGASNAGNFSTVLHVGMHFIPQCFILIFPS